MKPFHQGVYLAGDVTQIDRRTDKKSVGGKDAVNHRREVILPEAVTALSAFSLRNFEKLTFQS